MVQPVWRNDRGFYEAIDTHTVFIVFARFSHKDDGMAHGDLEIIAGVYIEAYYIHVLNSPAFQHLVV
jgi:hypothetical protein